MNAIHKVVTAQWHTIRTVASFQEGCKFDSHLCVINIFFVAEW